MRNVLAFLAAAVLTFAAIGWYLDWFHISATPTTPGQHRVNIDVNSEKISDDVERGVEFSREKIEAIIDSAQHDAAEVKPDRERIQGPPVPDHLRGEEVQESKGKKKP